MSQFDPSRPAVVHDKLTDEDLDWSPEWERSYRTSATPLGNGTVSWEGLVLDGWRSMVGGSL